MKVVTVVGARPQFVKAAVVSQALRQHGAQEVLVHTGQHYDDKMSDSFFRDLEMEPPSYNLAVGSGSHGVMTGRMLQGVEEVLLSERPDWVLVYGDTNSTVAGALAAAKLHIPVAHVEAGLRSDNRRMPEEINRILTDHCSDLLLTPSSVATQRLLKEGLASTAIAEVGDVMVDAARIFGLRARDQSSVLSRLELVAGEFILLTVHRAENTDSIDRLNGILEAVNRISRDNVIVWPMHPRVRACIAQQGIDLGRIENLLVMEPVGYLDMLSLLSGCSLVMTDSGGLQKEAYLFEKPCVTVRDETEWTELCDAGYNMLTGSDPEVIVSAVGSMLRCTLDWKSGLYGDGFAADRIVSRLIASDATVQL
ncbi:UDP-2,3-diacetamido-2,3-dideoxy-D-glucuronate 2-epimerase [Chlamydiales bacterium SCGC AG-110-P3]|nr:UDP-2,3-diacetamido-2,3-dideoxy-D-glucuronate 2-epimerase [Chlamydiales bacterium SCGC AG-110-P3]